MIIPRHASPLMLVVVLVLATIPGCAAGPDAPAAGTDGRLRWDDQTEYRILPAGQGFTVYVYYPVNSRQLDAGVARHLRQTVLDIAQRYAKEQGRELAPLDPRTVRIAPIRNRFTAVMDWRASADALLR